MAKPARDLVFSDSIDSRSASPKACTSSAVASSEVWVRMASR